MPEEEIDWNTCVEFMGPKRLLPTGIAYMPSNVDVEDFIVEGEHNQGRD